MGQNKLELVRQALAELGEVSDGELLAFLERTHGVRMEPKFLPLVRASLRGLEHLEEARQTAKAAAEKAVAEQANQKKRPRRGATCLPGGSGV